MTHHHGAQRYDQFCLKGVFWVEIGFGIIEHLPDTRNVYANVVWRADPILAGISIYLWARGCSSRRIKVTPYLT